MMSVLGNEKSENLEREREGEEGEVIVGIPKIPFDLFISVKTRHRHGLRFKDAFGNLVYTAAAKHQHRVLFDSCGNPIISIFRSPDGGGLWKGFKGEDQDHDQGGLLFTVEQTLNTFNKQEFLVTLTHQHDEIPTTLTMRGCLFYRSCTIYHHNSILAQTSLMHKLGFAKYFVTTSFFRVTIFPAPPPPAAAGCAHYNLIAALLVIFFDGRKTLDTVCYPSSYCLHHFPFS